MKKNGIIQIDDYLTLKDFEWELEEIRFKRSSQKLFLEVLMWEKHAKHSRTFEFDVPAGVDELGVEQCISYLLMLPQFAGSV
jgi:hypothetical protein